MLIFVVVWGLLPLVNPQSSVPLYPTIDITLPGATGTQCQMDLQLLSDGLKNRHLWAMQMLDASAQSATGVLYGSTLQLGNFDECLRVQEPIKVQFCLPALHASVDDIPRTGEVWDFVKDSNEPSSIRRDTIRSAICVPASCSPDDIQSAIEDQLNSTNSQNLIKFSVTVDDFLCTKTKDGGEIQAGEVAFWLTGVLLTLAAVLGTVLQKKKSEQILIRILKCFSISGNFDRLLEFREEERGHPLSVLHGMKVASIISVFYGHRLGVPLGFAISNYQEVEEYRRTPHNMFLPQSDLVVDTFFFISAVLTTYFMVHAMTKKPVNPFQAIFTRVARILPTYLFIIWFQASAAQRLGSGPLWNMIEGGESEPCQKYWWSNVLFINSFMSAEKTCLIHAWYLQCDIHFFILAVMLVTLMSRFPKFGLLLLSTLVLTTPIIPALIVYYGNLQPIVLFNDNFLSNPRSSAEFHAIYVKSYARVTVYLMGIVVGYILYKYRNSKYSISNTVSSLATMLGLSMLFTPMAIGGMYYTSEPPGPVFSAIFAAIRRPLWGMGLATLLAIHRFGPKCIISRAFASRAAIVLSKLTFGVYLIHFVLISANLGKVRAARPFNFFDVLGQGSGDLLSSCAYAVILYLLIELPFKRLFQEIFFAKTIQQCKDDIIRKQEVRKESVTIKL